VPLIKEIQVKRPVIVDLQPHELDDFMAQVRPEGIFLWVAATGEDEQQAILKRVARWNSSQ
jgi:hypothetical protein